MQTTVDPSAGPDAARLALKLVEWNYGVLCKDVITTLLKHGRQTFSELRHLSKIPADELRNALKILIQRNCVSVYLHSSELDRKAEQLYEAAMGRMLQIMRMPRFLNYAGKEFASLPYGDTCRDIIQVLLYQGQLQVSQLPHALRSLRGNAATFDDPPTLQRAVQALIQARLMERVPPCTLPPPPSHVHINARKKKAVPKAGSEEEQALQIEAAKLHQRRQFQKVRFDYTGLVTLQALTPPAEPAAPPQSEAAEASGPGSKGKRGSSAAAEPAAKRARGALGAVKKEEPGVNDGADAAVLWRVNYNEFNRRFRDQEIVELVRKQHGDESAAAMAALLAAAAPLDPEDPDSSDYDTSATVSVEDVARASKQLHGNASLTASKAETLLRKLSKEEFSVVHCVSQDRGQYCAAVSNALAVLRRGAIMTVIGKRFSEAAKRIWNMLLLDGQMEQKAVADAAMVPNGEAREALYALLNDGYLSLQDIPRNADRAPSRTFYTWRANMQGASARVTAQLYFAAANLLKRIDSETEARGDLMHKVEQVHEGRLDRSQIDEEAVKGLQRTVLLLETEMVRLDEQIALFNDM